ncbi:hypothetical protein DSM100688_0650 [Bifidobacterium ramosum]|uniref:Uncharacterized protein n=1 Tax=Bifidobacterium ramosum TaxID=1798158 RepID=A0A6L4X1L3_9BIFI|nr:hypothetical protein DSM100688_0650 [Bifidobacterium ramosum]
MQTNNNHHDMYHGTASYANDSQYDAYMYAEYGIER